MSIAIRLRSILFALVAISLVFASAPTADARAFARDGGSEVAFLASLNAQRAAHGVAPLQLSASMSQSAGSWTASMVDGSFLAHSSNLAGGVTPGWTKVGENVGRGRSVSSLTSAFMRSATHARNVLDPSFTHVGIAVITHPSGRVYTTHRFAATRSAQPAQPVQTARVVAAPVVAPVPAPVIQSPAPRTTPVVAPQAQPSVPNVMDQQMAERHEARMKLMASVFGS